jgi:DNA-binding CsgD family transcriptional regulator
MSRLTLEQRAEVVRLYVSGKTSIALAAEFGIAVATVLRIVRISGEVVRSSANGQEKLTLKQRDEVVRRYVAGETSRKLAAQYGVSYLTVLSSVRRAGEQVRSKSSPSMFTEEQEQKICNKYSNGAGISDLSLMFNCADCTIYKVLKTNGVALRSRAFRLVDHSALKNLDDEAALYWCGFLFADGSVKTRTSSSVLSVNLSAVDKDHLFKLQSFLKTDFFVASHNYPGQSYSSNPKFRLCVVSDEVCDDLLSYGRYDGALHPSLWGSRHFWRGLVDGDGSLGIYFDSRSKKSRPMFSVCGTQCMMDNFKKRFSLSGHNSKAKVRLHSSGSIYHYGLNGRVGVECIKWLYGDATVYLDRKYETAQRILREYG